MSGTNRCKGRGAWFVHHQPISAKTQEIAIARLHRIEDRSDRLRWERGVRSRLLKLMGARNLSFKQVAVAAGVQYSRLGYWMSEQCAHGSNGIGIPQSIEQWLEREQEA